MAEYLTVAEVAEYYRTAQSTVRYWRMIGKLHGVRMGRKVLFSREEINENDRKLAAAQDGGAPDAA